MKRILILAALALSFTSCFYVVRPVNADGSVTSTEPAPQPSTQSGASVTVTISFGVQVGNVIQDFQPTRGNGATYGIGEPVSLSLTSRENGYVTLVIYNPFDYRNAEIRNIPVSRGQNIIPRNVPLSAAAPAGTTRFRAFFTPQPSNVSFLGGFGERYLETQTFAYLEPYPVQSRDVKEAFLFVR